MPKPDDKFFDRADAHIELSNNQLDNDNIGTVSASMLYGTARFNAYRSALDFDNGIEMQEAKKEILNYFLSQYEKMLEENIDDYIDNFDAYLK
ncbi:MAG: DUF3144 domain-containing protein [Chitinophagales bacterium]